MSPDFYIGPWLGNECLKQIEADYAKKIKKACIHLANEVKQVLSTPSPPSSIPGEPPHRRDGELRRSITWEVDGTVGRVGTNKIYGRHLEIGWANQGPRSFLRSTLAKQYNSINDIMNKPMPGRDPDTGRFIKQ